MYLLLTTAERAFTMVLAASFEHIESCVESRLSAANNIESEQLKSAYELICVLSLSIFVTICAAEKREFKLESPCSPALYWVLHMNSLKVTKV
mmetsp:Transcript_32192/g.44151  ORF Transcript_32192/g.44151 Transcript_32192/m.44151 type:complete len:93 (+) Transcript_32192:100-378(+)